MPCFGGWNFVFQNLRMRVLPVRRQAARVDAQVAHYRHEAAMLESRMRELREAYGATVVVVSHSPRVADFADRVIELHDGRVVTS